LKNICIITPSIGKYSETFIQNQIDYLPFNKKIVTTGIGELADENGTPLAALNFISKLRRFIGRKLLNKNFESQQNKLLAKYLIKNKVEHVLFQYGTTAKVGYGACVMANIPYTVHFHGYDAYTYLFDRKYYEHVLKYAKNVIVVSDHMKNKLISLGGNQKSIKIIPYGSNFSTKEPFNSKQKKTNTKFLAVGRFVEKKAPYITILAFSEALKVKNDITLDMIGDGDLLNLCKDIVKGLGLNNEIKFHGSCNHEMVRKMMHECDYFIQHSKIASSGDSEGLPNAIIEALNMRKPVISTFHSGIPEIVKDGVNGFLSEELDIQGMANNIIDSTNHNFSFSEMKFLKLENSIKQLTDVLNG
jgi:glycosyltransferase involved in cell wall biosynthesis